MASFLSKVRVKSAADSKSKFNLDCSHITTTDFMEFMPIYSRELVPNSSINVDCKSFVRVAPMPQPTFGSVYFHNRAFFVPYITVWKGFNDFINNTPHVVSSGSPEFPSNVPTIANGELVQLIVGLSTSLQPEVEGSDGPYDFVYNNRHYNLSRYGRYVLKVLEALGYKVVFTQLNPRISYSALPLLACAKVYLDWYVSSSYYKVTDISVKVESILNRDMTYSLTLQELLDIFGFIHYVCYDSDYFTSAWDKPMSPSEGVSTAGSDFVIHDFVTDESNASDNGNGAIVDVSNGEVSAFILKTVHRLQDYLTRHQIVGARAIDRFLARYGVSLHSEICDRSQYVGKTSFPIIFGDVMSSSETDNANLGDYAGKGLGFDEKGKFEFESKEFGMFIVINSVLPDIGYVQGVDRQVLRTSLFEFFTPEFDGLGTQPISSAELYVPFGSGNDANDSVLVNGIGQHIFGFTPRYADYKVAHDRLTGDFRYNSVEGYGKDGYHLFRMFDGSSFKSLSDMIHSPNFVSGADHSQYDRIAYDTEHRSDIFRCIYRFNVDMVAPMRPLYDTFDFSQGGKEIDLDVNGSKAN